ncbi:MAG: HD domain-containing protein [Candidatus Riflebacteria bacterium]|nr:HD domain-containing protein [Candidatus Riflebacteria bacterium]
MRISLERLLAADRVKSFMREASGAAAELRVTAQPVVGSIPVRLPEGETAFLSRVVSLSGIESGFSAGQRSEINAKEVALKKSAAAVSPVETATELSLIAVALGHLFAYEHEISDMTQELSSLYEEITLLYDLSSAFSGTLRFEELQREAIRQIAEALGVKRISLLMLNDEKDGLILTAGLGIVPEDIGKLRFSRGQGLAWRVIELNRPMIVNDLSSAPDYVPGKQSERALLLSPMASKRGILGVLTVSDKCDGSDFSSKDEKLLSAIAHQMGSVWENARLYRETRELFFNTVEALSAAIDAKDPYTHGHSRRVTEFSIATAEEMGLIGEKLERIQISALLHDIGKLGVNESILRKPDKLTNEEYGQIKLHPAIGADIMSRVKNLVRFIPGMVDHHEKFDGTGYPEGLRGEAISQAGRIIAVADTFDAITSNRPYHENCRGKPAAIALAELERCRGTHFDPDIVDAFKRVFLQGRIRADSDDDGGVDDRNGKSKGGNGLRS